MEDFKKCDNPECDRLVKKEYAMCCTGCRTAHEDGYEVHESGFLGHTGLCDIRHQERGIDKLDA